MTVVVEYKDKAKEEHMPEMACAYIDADRNFISFSLPASENQVFHALLSLSVNFEEFRYVSLKDFLVPQTGIDQPHISRTLKSLKNKKIIDYNYLRNEHKLQIKLLPREGWLSEVPLKEKNNKEKEGKSEAKKIDFISENAEIILAAVEKYSKNRDQNQLINAIDKILNIKK